MLIFEWIEILLIIIWFAIIFALFGSYFLYPITISLLPKVSRENIEFNLRDSTIYLIIPCYNEEGVIEKKIRNSFELKTELNFYVYVMIDQSIDKTYEVAKKLETEYKNLKVIDKGYRNGKNDSINKAFDLIKPNENDLLFLTDANTFYKPDVIDHLLAEISKGSVVVGGSMLYLDQNTKSAKAEGLYWKYEEWIRKNESKLGRLLTINGGIMMMVAKYFKNIPTYVPNDFETPLRIVSTHQTSFSEKAIGIEYAIQHEEEEMNRKKRMANRQMNAILYHWKKLSVITKIQVLFHKIIRWFGLQIFVLQLIISILLYDVNYLFKFINGFNIFILIIILLSILLRKNNFFSTIYHAIAVHHFGFLGAFSSLFGTKVSVWSKAKSNR